MRRDLTAAEVAKQRKIPGSARRVSKNLYLQVKDSGSASWLFRYMLDRETHWMGLGSYDNFSLAEARQRARSNRQLLDDDLDPLQHKRQQRTADQVKAAKALTFGAAAEQYLAAQSQGWNPKHKWQWETTFRGTARTPAATAAINDLPIDSITTALMLKVLEPLWARTPETASRIRGRIESVLGWATARGYRDGENVARWKGHLDKLLPAPSKLRRVEHHPALPYAEAPAFMAELRGIPFTSARALEFTILAVARTNEVIGATWGEFDLGAKVWAIPGARMKAGKAHTVPLSERVIEILKALPREPGNDHVFIGGKAGAGLSNMAMLKLLKGMRPGLTVHGFRSTFRDWCAERTNYANHIVEMALAHTVGDKVEAAYRRGDLLAKRAKLMDAWASYCAQKPTDGKVISLLQSGSARD
jgi:integrase